MTKTDWTAEEVRDYADACRLLHKGPVIADMLDNLANRIEGDERAVPVAFRYIGPDGGVGTWTDAEGVKLIATLINGWRCEFAYSHPPAQEQPGWKVPDVAAMVNRFIGWPLPKDFAPDAGISYNPEVNINQVTGEPYPNSPSGTNLFTATQAEAMFHYALASPTPPKEK